MPPHSLIVLLFGLASAAVAQDSTRAALAGTPATANPPATEEERGFWRDLDLKAGLTNVYESNIGHETEPTPALGLVPTLGVRARRRVGGGRLSLAYGIARHTYSNSEEWDRTSHEFVAGLEAEAAQDFVTYTEAEVSLGGSSEDRELANQYQLRQAFALKLSQAQRPGSAASLRYVLGAYGTLRYKTVPGDPEDSAFKPNVGLVYQQRWPDGFHMELETRLEANREQEERGNYYRATYAFELRLPLSEALGDVEVDLRRRRKSYTARLAEDEEGEDTDLLRRDTQWTLGLGWHPELLRHVTLTLGAEHEWRTSNDAGKDYAATVFLLGVGYKF